MKGRDPVSLGKNLTQGHVVIVRIVISNESHLPASKEYLYISLPCGLWTQPLARFWPVGHHSCDPRRALSSTCTLGLSSGDVSLSGCHLKAQNERPRAERLSCPSCLRRAQSLAVLPAACVVPGESTRRTPPPPHQSTVSRKIRSLLFWKQYIFEVLGCTTMDNWNRPGPCRFHITFSFLHMFEGNYIYDISQELSMCGPINIPVYMHQNVTL